MHTLRSGLLPLALSVLLTRQAVAAPAPPAPPSPSYADSPEIRRLLHWEHFPLHVYFATGDLATKERTDAVRAGFGQWVHATKDFVHYEVVAKPAQAEVVVTFLPLDAVPNQGGSCGHTTMTFLTLTLKSANILLATTGVTPSDLQATAAHEFGHALGIDGHSDDPGDLMYAVLTHSPDGEPPLPAHDVTARDLNTLKVCYPAFDVPPPRFPSKPRSRRIDARTAACHTRSMRRTFSICLLLALIASQSAARAAPASADYSHAPGLRALLHWERFPLRVSFSAGRLATRERKALVLAGLDEWVRATRGVVSYQIVTEEAQADISVTFAPHPPISGPPPGGLTTLTRTGTVLKKAAISLTERDEDPDGFQATAAHEFGHALGIDGHSDDPDDLMFPVMSSPRPMVRNDESDPPLPVRTVTRRDVNTLQSAYPGLVLTPAKR